MTVHGRNMGVNARYTAIAREGQTGCEATEWESDTSMRCKVGQGVSGTRRVVMTAGQRSGSVTESMSTDMIGLSVLSSLNRLAVGSESVTVHGTSMGNAGYTGRGREGQTGCEATEWESETSVRCQATQGGGGGTRRLVMTAGEQGGSVTGAWSVDLLIMTFTGRGWGLWRIRGGHGKGRRDARRRSGSRRHR